MAHRVVDNPVDTLAVQVVVAYRTTVPCTNDLETTAVEVGNSAVE